MDELFGRVTQTAVNYALKSAVPIVAGYTFRQCSRLLQQTPKSTEREKIVRLHDRLERKIEVISPAIDMIDLFTARGNTSLEAAAGLSRDIRLSIQELGVRLSDAAKQEETKTRTGTHSREQNLLRIIADMELLLEKIVDAVPLLHLAITASGAELSSNLPTGISPSRLLQASTFLTNADASYASHPGKPVQIGPVFTVSLYMLFAGHSRRSQNGTDVRETTWSEVMHKAQVKLIRLPLKDLHVSKNMRGVDTAHSASFEASELAAEYAYQLIIVEDLDDDRVHTFEAGDPQPEAFEGVEVAGRRELLPVHEVAKIFYADTGKLLGIEGDSGGARPVLLLKRDTQAEPPRRMQARRRGSVSAAAQLEGLPRRATTPEVGSKHQSPWKLPEGLDPEWLAFEVYPINAEQVCESDDTDDEDDTPETQANSSGLLTAFAKLRLPTSSSPISQKSSPVTRQVQSLTTSRNKSPAIKTTLSLLEMLIKLTALQQYRQESHLAIEDELLNMFLEDSSTTGHGEKAQRQRARRDAFQRVGFDPFDHSPLKLKMTRDISRAQSAKHDVPTTPPSKPKDDRIVAAVPEVPALLEAPSLQPTPARVSFESKQ